MYLRKGGDNLKLKAIRERLNLTQAQTAKKCDISLSTVTRIEQKPDFKPSGRIVKKICKGLKVKVDELI